MKRVINRIKRFKCQICRLWFNSKYKLTEHNDLNADYHEMRTYEDTIEKQNQRRDKYVCVSYYFLKQY